MTIRRERWELEEFHRSQSEVHGQAQSTACEKREEITFDLGATLSMMQISSKV